MQFTTKYIVGSLPEVALSGQDDSLIFFFLHLLSRLQKLGTAVMLDVEEYAKALQIE